VRISGSSKAPRFEGAMFNVFALMIWF
jgi:hypothetical protein